MIRIACVDISRWTPGLYQALYAAAAPQRQARADRCRRIGDSFRCIAADALLRFALAETFGTGETHILGRTSLGKPRLESREDFHFSLSHSGAWAAIAWGSSPVGLDVEQVHTDRDIAMLTRRFFTPEEQEFVFSREQAPAFTRIWTAKESYLKYLGTGLTKALDSFSVFSPEDGIHYFFEVPDAGSVLCLCTREAEYDLRFLSGEALLALPEDLYREAGSAH